MIAQHKAEIPFITLLLPFIAGISVGLWVLPLVSILLPAYLLALFSTIFILLNLGYQRLKLYLNRQWIGGLLIHSILFLSGWLCVSLTNECFSDRHFSKVPAGQLLIQVNNEPKLSGRYIRFTAVVRQAVSHHKFAPVDGNLLVITPATQQTHLLQYGDELLVKANYTTVTPPYNPAEFNYKQYLSYQNIHYQLFATSNELLIVQHNTGNAVTAYALQLRQQMVNHLKAGIRDTNASAVASTLMLGYKADLSNDVLQAYSKTGTIHVLSVSGAHVAIIYALITLCLGFLNRYKYGRLLNAVLSILLIWAYSLLTGFSPAVCRAAVMITLFIIGKTYNRHISTINILAASAFLLLIYNPYLLADAGFQLSYFAVFGLFAFHPAIYRQLQIRNKWLNKLWYVCAASVAAQLITFPLSVYYFHQFPVYFLLSNLLIIIPTEIIMVAGGLFLALFKVPYVSAWLALVLEYTIILMNKGLAYLEHLPYASAGQLWITPLEYVILFILILLVILFLHQRKALQLISALLCVLVLGITTGFKKYNAAITDTVTFLDLKKYTGIILKSGRKAVVITDIATTDKNFAYSITPCLDSEKVIKQTIVNFNQNVQTSFCLKKGNYVQLLKHSILIVNDSLKYRPLNKPVQIDELFITGSPHISLNLLRQSYIYSTVIADANNSKQSIERYRLEAEKQHKKFISLKRNKSITLASN